MLTDPPAWLHPIGGAIGVGLVVWVGLQGVRSRHRAPYAAAARGRHARYTPLLYGYVLLVGAAGFGSVVWLRHDLEPAASVHSWLMVGMLVALTAGALVSRLFPGHPRLRVVHQRLGVSAMVLALVGAALGLGLLPG